MLPFLEDNAENISGIVKLAYENGAKFICPAFGVTLRQNQRAWFYSKLEELFPSVKEKYIKQYGDDYECRSPKAKDLWDLFRSECEKYRILYKMEEIIQSYRQGYLS